MAFPLATTDRLLLRFSRTGDPRVLGRLFDRTAPELLRVATWLCGNRTDAEDLLQRTFVTVIEARSTYDPARRALPWLCGIVGNHAKKLHEQRQRRIDSSSGPAAQRDPAAIAADAELAAMVARLRAEMGSPYAEVLDLHLGQGLNAKEIAERLDRPAGTVRTQLVRALALLRKQLPTGFVAGMLIAPSVQAASLATVRAMVMAKSGVGTATLTGAMAMATTSSIGGTLMAKKLVVVIPALALLLGGGAWALWQADADGQMPETTRAVGAEIEGRQQQPLANELVAEPTQREAVLPVSGEVVDPGFATLVIRIKWQHDGSPAQAVGVRVLPQPGSRFLNHAGLTDITGTLRLQGIRPGPCWLTSAFTKLAELDLDAGVVQTIELTAQRAGVVRGTVVDADGRAVADARLWLSDVASWRDGFEVGRSDEAGRFELPIGSSHYLGARKAGHTPSYLRDIEGRGTPEVTLRLRGPAGAVHGKVFDANGQPFAGVIVEIGMPGGWTIPGSTRHERLVHPTPPRVRTSTSGEFHFEGVEPRNNTLHAWASGHAPFQGTVLVEAGKASETIVAMHRGAIVEGTVRDARQQPVAGAYVVANRHDHDSLGATSTNALGQFRLEDLLPGSIHLSVKHDDATAQTSVQVAAGGLARWDAVLAGGRSLAGTVVGPDRKPLAGLQVGCLEDSAPIPLRWATTDPDGHFILADVGSHPIDLIVQQGDVPLVHNRKVRTDTENLVIALTTRDLPSATVQGRIVDTTGKPVAASIVVMPRAFRFGASVQSDPATGRFQFGPKPAGSYNLTIEAPGFGRVPLGTVNLQPNEERKLEDLVLAAAGRVEIAVPSGADQQGNMLKIVRDDGIVVTFVMVDHRAATAELQPGTYTVVAQVGNDGAATSFTVQSGATVRCELRCVPMVRVVVDFRDPGPTAKDLEIATVVRDASGTLVDVFQTYPSNDPPLRQQVSLPPGSYHLDCRASDGRRATAPVSIRSATESPALTIDLPAK